MDRSLVGTGHQTHQVGGYYTLYSIMYWTMEGVSDLIVPTEGQGFQVNAGQGRQGAEIVMWTAPRRVAGDQLGHQLVVCPPSRAVRWRRRSGGCGCLRCEVRLAARPARRS